MRPFRYSSGRSRFGQDMPRPISIWPWLLRKKVKSTPQSNVTVPLCKPSLTTRKPRTLASSWDGKEDSRPRPPSWKRRFGSIPTLPSRTPFRPVCSFSRISPNWRPGTRRRALEIDPGSADAHAALAGVLTVEGETAAAIAEYEQALQIEPKSARSPLLPRFGPRSPAKHPRGDRPLRRGDPALQPNQPAMLNQLAWVATDPDDSLRDGRGDRAGPRAAKVTGGSRPGDSGHWAAAEAEAGHYPGGGAGQSGPPAWPKATPTRPSSSRRSASRSSSMRRASLSANRRGPGADPS